MQTYRCFRCGFSTTDENTYLSHLKEVHDFKAGFLKTHEY